MNPAYRRVEHRDDSTLPVEEETHGCFYLLLDGGEEVGLVETWESPGEIDAVNEEYFYAEPYILVRRTPQAVVWIVNPELPYWGLFEKCAVFVFDPRQYCEALRLNESWFREIPPLSDEELSGALRFLLKMLPSHRLVETSIPSFGYDETGRSLVKQLREDIESEACTVDCESDSRDEWTEYEVYSRGSLCLCVEHNVRRRGWRVLLPTLFPVRFCVKES